MRAELRYVQTWRSANQSLGCIAESRLANQRLGCTSVGGEGSDMTAAVGRLRDSHFVYNGYSCIADAADRFSWKLYVSPIINRWRHIRV